MRSEGRGRHAGRAKAVLAVLIGIMVLLPCGLAVAKGGGSFGGSRGGGGSFGGSRSSGGGSFGGSRSSAPSGGSFGGSRPSSPSPTPSAPARSGSGSFGNPGSSTARPSTPSSGTTRSGGSFGGGTPATGGSFGGSRPSSSSFGTGRTTSSATGSFGNSGSFGSSSYVRSSSSRPSYYGRSPLTSSTTVYMGRTVPVYGYGGWSSYSFYWGTPAWYYWTPFHPAFYYRPPVYYDGGIYPGGFSFGRALMGMLSLVLVFAFIVWLFGRIGGGGNVRYTTYN